VVVGKRVWSASRRGSTRLAAKANYISHQLGGLAGLLRRPDARCPVGHVPVVEHTYTYRAPIQIYVWGSLVHQVTANVSVARVSKNIITAYPSVTSTADGLLVAAWSGTWFDRSIRLVIKEASLTDLVAELSGSAVEVFPGPIRLRRHCSCSLRTSRRGWTAVQTTASPWSSGQP
jgi:hypothetical protein